MFEVNVKNVKEGRRRGPARVWGSDVKIENMYKENCNKENNAKKVEDICNLVDELMNFIPRIRRKKAKCGTVVRYLNLRR